jgi:SRSO17 transposase
VAITCWRTDAPSSPTLDNLEIGAAAGGLLAEYMARNRGRRLAHGPHKIGRYALNVNKKLRQRGTTLSRNCPSRYNNINHVRPARRLKVLEISLKEYCAGLLMPFERKSVESMAAAMAPSRASAEHQSLLHFVGQSAWSDEALLSKVRELVAPAIETQGRLEAWIVDDTGFVKKGVHSVGVARQYCGRLGKTDNCQVAVPLSIANHAASLPIAYRLYLTEEWADHAARRRKVHVPDEVKFQTKPEIALAQIKAALAAGVVLTVPTYGSDGAFRAGVTAMGLTYAVGVQSTLSLWPPGREPLPPKPWSGRGRKPSRVRRDADHRPVSAKTLAMALLLPEAWREVSWGEGSNQTLSSRFAAVRVRPASRDGKHAAPHPHEWLLVEWPEGEKESTKYWLSTLPEYMPIEVLVDTAKLCWRIERDYEELKSELGLADFEGRGWRGFHHHAILSSPPTAS